MPSLSAMKDLDAADALPKGLGEPIRPEVKTERQRDLEKRKREISNFEAMKDTVKEAAKPAPKGLPVAKPLVIREVKRWDDRKQQRNVGVQAAHGADYGDLEARCLAHANAAQQQDFAKYFEEQSQQRPGHPAYNTAPRSAGSASFDEMYRQVGVTTWRMSSLDEALASMRSMRVGMSEPIIKGRRAGVLTFDDYAENETPEIRDRVKAALLKARRAAPALKADAEDAYRLWGAL